MREPSPLQTRCADIARVDEPGAPEVVSQRGLRPCASYDASVAEDPSETIYLVGTSGHPNFGDEFIAASWLRFLARTRPHADVWLDCPAPGQAAHLFHGLHPRLRTTDSLWRLVWETVSLDRPDADDLISHRVHHLGTPRFDLGLAAIRSASTLHFIGGGHINGIWPAHVGLLRAGAALRDISDVRLLATGLGLTPVSGEATLMASLPSFDHVSVRDAASAEASGATVAPDDAFLGVRDLAGFGSQAPPGSGEVWVCLQHDMSEPGVFDTIIEATRAALTSRDLAGRTVRYLEALPGVDRAAYDRLADLIPEDNFVPFVRLWREGFPAAAGQTWITTRFHLHLLASACGAAGTALEVNQDYYRVKHGSLAALGAGWSVTPARSATIVEPTASAGFPYKSRMLAQDKLTEARKLYPVAAPQPVVPPPAHRRNGWRSRLVQA